MILLLERAAAASPGQTAVVTPEGSSSYGELLEDAHRVGAALLDRGLTRFALVEPDVGWVIRILAGAALVGAEPCQYQADSAVADLEEAAAALGHTAVVTRRDDLGVAFEVVRPDELTKAAPGRVPTVSDTQPLVIRTTGTTGLPKAARHDWQTLARTVAAVRPTPDQRWLLAYGPHQFAGIQMLLHVVASQSTLVAPFPRQPRDGLNALLNDQVTCVSATPTYWRFLLAEARGRKVELPSLRQVTLGGEASSADLLNDLRAAFPDARVSQVYASTEFGSMTSVTDGLPGIGVEALFSETNRASNLRFQEGQLWVRGGAGMLGYVGDAEVGPAGVGTDDWRPTGDLAEIVDGRLLFRGRDSEVINVGGVKVHPLPVENRIVALPSVALARVFGRANKLTGAIVAAEVVPEGGIDHADVDAIRLEIKSAVADLPRAWQPRSVAFVETLATKGDKTVRRMET
jgi:acyl-CoA synthetase (AMP-forming)/AMP-acid ligase II